jgi:hypothetical protein
MNRIRAGWHKPEAKVLIKSYSPAIFTMDAKYDKIRGLPQCLAEQIPQNLVGESWIIFVVTVAGQVLKLRLDR